MTCNMLRQVVRGQLIPAAGRSLSSGIPTERCSGKTSLPVPAARRSFSTSFQRNHKVCVCGAAGGIGQPLSLLIKMNKLVTQLALYDLRDTPGVAADLSHIDTMSEVKGFCGPEQLPEALQCSEIVVIVAGLPRKPGMKREDLFKVNATIVKEITTQIAKLCPKALICIVTNPVNGMVPLAGEVLKKNKVFDPKRLFGITTLDVTRARVFAGQILECDPSKVKIDCIGGHAGATIIPVFSQIEPKLKDMEHEDYVKLTKKVQDAGTVVVEAKAGKGSATLSTAYATSIFVNALLNAMKSGSAKQTECAYVKSDVTKAEYFTTALALGKDGISKNLGLPDLNKYEADQVECALPELIKSIKEGADYGKT